MIATADILDELADLTANEWSALARRVAQPQLNLAALFVAAAMADAATSVDAWLAGEDVVTISWYALRRAAPREAGDLNASLHGIQPFLHAIFTASRIARRACRTH
jgi:hypothetical protein